MKLSRKQILWIGVPAGLVAIAVAWLALSIFISHTPKARLKHALNLDRLPKSVQILGQGADIWTDYITLHSVSLDPSDFQSLLEGREFVEDSYGWKGIKEHHADYASHLPSIDVDICLQVHEDPPEGPVCRVFANKARTEAFIEYLAD